MAPKRKTPLTCQHTTLQVDVSPHAAEAGFKRIPPEKRVAATTPLGRVTEQTEGNSKPQSEYTFPAPLVLHDDLLSQYPREPPQSLRSFIQEGARNPLTNRRKTLYVGRVTSIDPGISQVKHWSTPCCIASSSSPTTGKKKKGTTVPTPKTDEIIEYLSAYYHPLPVKPLEEATFVPWEDTPPSSAGQKQLPQAQSRRKGARVKAAATLKGTKDDNIPSYIGLRLGQGTTRIRTRPCPDGKYPRQINLNDAMDALLEVVPEDAHSAILLMDQDMYDADEDEFCCGLAYGGSRVAVISTARYHPVLDWEDYQDEEGVDWKVEVINREHMWPFSHCKAFVDDMCLVETETSEPKRKKAKVTADGTGVQTANTPLGAAIQAALAAPGPEKDLAGLWLGRVARTVAHEIGHCFAIAHCVYYACSMQGTSCIAEDNRQPPYLCPVCLAKVTRAIADVEKGVGEKELVVGRYRALIKFCEGRKRVAMFAGFHAWLKKRMEELVGGDNRMEVV